jgi:Flp pilus assembly protein TadG
MSSRRLRGTSASRRGQSLVEFALVFPIAILLLMAVFDVGRAVFAFNGLTNAAREGARMAIVNQDETMIEQRIEEMTFATGVANAGDPNLVQFHKDGPNATAPTSNPVCAPVSMGCVAIVTVETDWRAITPVIGQIIGPITFTARSELAVEFVCPNPNIPAYVSSASCPKKP